MRLKLLDLYGGGGGAARGYQAAGFDVTGVDINPQPRYPGAFVQADALTYLAEHARDFDAVHASPPCQRYTAMSNKHRARFGEGYDERSPDLLEPTLFALSVLDKPYIVENVPGAASLMPGAVQLCGSSFGLGVHRHRLFVTSFLALTPPCQHDGPAGLGVYGKAPDGRRLWDRKDGSIFRAPSSTEEAAEAMGLSGHGLTWNEVKESIPPAYTEHLGRQLARTLRVAA